MLIGLGFVYCSLANVNGAGRLVGGLVFSVGLLLVIVFGANLFTSSTMTLVAKADKQISWRQLGVNWLLVFSGNFLGALLLLAFILLSGHPFGDNGAIGLYYIKLAEHKLSHPFYEAVGLGILCNLMVCLAVWMSFAGRTLVDKLVAVALPVGLFVAAGFEHSVANMFMVPAGIYTFQLASPDMLAQLPDVAHLAQVLNWRNFIFLNLIPVTIGNIIGGGVMVGLFQWCIHLKADSRAKKTAEIHETPSIEAHCQK